MRKITCLSLLLACFLVEPVFSAGPKVKEEPYEWKNVQIVGGGFVDGIVFHPTEKNLRYCRTDMGGAYRWNESQKRWIPLLDWISYDDNNLVGVESIALDKNDPDALYLSCGTYTRDGMPDGTILRSFDRGKTFERVNVPFKMGGNENGRGNGERMAVDPVNGKIIYVGTRKAGLWKSTNRGKSWAQVTSFPDITEAMPKPEAEQAMPRWNRGPQGCGIVFVLFDQSKSNKKGCSDIYVGVSLMDRDNMFRSTDGGETWEAIPGQPTAYRPTHAVIASDGTIYISYGTNPGPAQMNNGGVWKLETKTGKWTDITPDKPEPDKDARFGYVSVSVDAKNPKALIASSFYRPGNRGGEEIFRSTNGGESWIEVMKTGKKYDYSLAPYVQHTGIHWLFDIEIDPFNSDHAMFTTGFGGFETFNLSQADKGESTTWSVMSTGIEETVPLELCAPPVGAHLITGVGDYGGFVHWDLDKPVPEGNYVNPHFGNTDGVTVAWKKPEIVLRVGVESGSRGKRNIAYSEDFGKTWQPANMPNENSSHGHIAVSADGKTWVWTPQRSVPYYTTDKGNTWTAIDIPKDVRIVADKENPNKFYGIDIWTGKLFTSIDAAKTFTTTDLNLAKGIPARNMNRADSRGGQDRIYATPGFENDRWIAAFDGLYHSATQAEPFEMQNHVTEIHAFGFGKEAPGEKYPALYLIGIVDGQRGIFRSTDKAQSWVRINDDQHQWGLLLHITGDPKAYGRVYVGTHGRGAMYGDPK